jgi:hypothetical protein
VCDLYHVQSKRCALIPEDLSKDVKLIPLGIPRRSWVDSIRMDPGEVGWGDVDWISLTQGRKRWRAIVNSVLNLRVP